MSENRQRTSVTPPMVIAGAQAFDAGLVSSLKASLQLWLLGSRSRFHAREGSGRAAGWWKP